MRFGPHAFKVLCAEGMVAKFMREKGQEIKQIEDQTSTHWQFSSRGDFYPGTQLRILTVCGAETSFVFDALTVILDHVESRSQEEQEAGKSGDAVDNSGRMIFRGALSKAAAGAIIGNKGERIKGLREATGAQIDIARDVVDQHQLVTVCGSREQVGQVVEELNTGVQQDANEEWFQQWAGQRGVSGGMGPMGNARRNMGMDGQRNDRGGHHDRHHGGGGHRDGKGQGRGCTIFVGHLSQATSAGNLREYFEGYGDVLETDVRTDGATGRSKGFGFVTFADKEAVEACMDRKSEHNIDGRWVDVKRYGENDDGDMTMPPPPHQMPMPLPAAPAAPRGQPHQHHGHGGGRGGDPQHASDVGSVDWLAHMAAGTNPDYLELQYCISCSFPSAKCGALIGKRGDKITEVQRATNADIVISKKEPNEAPDAHRTVTITGTLLSIYGAHLMLMRHYNDDEAQHAARTMGGCAQPESAPGAPHVHQLQRQLAQLTEELAMAQGRRPAPSGPAYGRGGAGGRR